MVFAKREGKFGFAIKVFMYIDVTAEYNQKTSLMMSVAQSPAVSELTRSAECKR
jgi:hypothetical protein